MYTNPPVNCHTGSTSVQKTDATSPTVFFLPPLPTTHLPHFGHRLTSSTSSLSILHSSFLSTARRHLFVPPPPLPSISLSRTTATNPLFYFPSRACRSTWRRLVRPHHRALLPIASINHINHHGYLRLHVLRPPAGPPACRLHLWLQAEAQA